MSIVIAEDVYKRQGLDLKHGQPDEKDSKLIRHVGLLAGLWFLNLEESDIGDTDLEEVKKLPLLKYLNVNGTGISGCLLYTSRCV